jgi:hypothetical protein
MYAIPPPSTACNSSLTTPSNTKNKILGSYLPASQVLRNKRDLDRSLGTRPDLPRLRLERVAGLDGRRESHAEESEAARVAPANRLDQRTRGEAERREPVQDDTSEAGGFADCGVCRERISIPLQTDKLKTNRSAAGYNPR